MTDTPEGGPVVRPFAEFLRQQSRGATHIELSEALHRLIAAVQDTGKAGALTLTVKVAQMKDRRTLTVTDSIGLKLPEHDRSASIWWPDADGNLTRSDPDQLTIDGPLAVVDTSTGEIVRGAGA